MEALEYMSEKATDAFEFLTGNFGFLAKKPERPESSNVKLVLKEKTSFRIKKIEVVKFEAIEQIKLSYTDDTEWTYGHDFGDKDSRALVMTKGEYLVRVTHEKLESQESAGGMVEFETNKGRVFIYKPNEMDSISLGEKGELKTIRAQEGYEIISLMIRYGELHGSEQQPVPDEEQGEQPKQWYVLSYIPAEDDYLTEEEEEIKGESSSTADEFASEPDRFASDKSIHDKAVSENNNNDLTDNVNTENTSISSGEITTNTEIVSEKIDRNKNIVSGNKLTDNTDNVTKTSLVIENINNASEISTDYQSIDNNVLNDNTKLDCQIETCETTVVDAEKRDKDTTENNIDKTVIKSDTNENENKIVTNNILVIKTNNDEFERIDCPDANDDKGKSDEEPKENDVKHENKNDEAENENKDQSHPENESTEKESEIENANEEKDTDSDNEGEDKKTENEFNDDYIKYTHFSSKSEAFQEWNVTKSLIKQKEGRSAILIDCITSKIIKKAGSDDKIENCREKAILRGLCLPMDDENAPIVDILKLLYETLANKTELFLFILSFAMMLLTFFLGVQITLLDGQIMAALVTNQNASNWRKMNKVEEFMCTTSFLNCDGSYLALCKSLLLVYLLGSLFNELLNILYDILRSILAESKTVKMSRKLFLHVMSMDKDFFDTNHEYERGMSVGSLHNLLFDTIPLIVTSALRYLIVAYSLIALDFNIGLFSVGFTLFYNVCIYTYFVRLDTEKYKKERRMDLIGSKATSDAFSMIKTVKLFANEKFHIKEYEAWFNRYVEEIKKTKSWAPLRGLLEEMMHMVVYCCIVYFGYMSKDADLDTGDFTGFIILYGQLHGLYANIRDCVIYVSQEFCSVQRCKALKAAKPKMKNGTKVLDDIQGEIKFSNVEFRYPSRPKDKVLKGLNLTIKPNCTTAIVGKSGAGKSTLAMLITRLYDPESGTITIDGHDMKTIDAECLRSNIAIVDQSPELFNRTLADNIAYGVVDGTECTEEMIDNALKIANCDFINDFREGCYTFAGYGGSSLSGGQLQRIAIARAAIRNPKILILDEATSALDAENEKEVQSALENLMKGRTVIVIAHRLSTIRNADRIICLKEGALAEEGTHDELMDKNGIYYKLVSTQIVERKKQREEDEERYKNNDEEELEKDFEKRKQNSDTSSEDEEEEASSEGDKSEEKTSGISKTDKVREDTQSRNDDKTNLLFTEGQVDSEVNPNEDASKTIDIADTEEINGNEHQVSEIDQIKSKAIETTISEGEKITGTDCAEESQNLSLSDSAYSTFSEDSTSNEPLETRSSSSLQYIDDAVWTQNDNGKIESIPNTGEGEESCLRKRK